MMVDYIFERAYDAFLVGTEPMGSPRPPPDPSFRCPFAASLPTPRGLQDQVADQHSVVRIDSKAIGSSQANLTTYAESRLGCQAWL